MPSAQIVVVGDTPLLRLAGFLSCAEVDHLGKRARHNERRADYDTRRQLYARYDPRRDDQPDDEREDKLQRVDGRCVVRGNAPYRQYVEHLGERDREVRVDRPRLDQRRRDLETREEPRVGRNPACQGEYPHEALPQHPNRHRIVVPH